MWLFQAVGYTIVCMVLEMTSLMSKFEKKPEKSRSKMAKTALKDVASIWSNRWAYGKMILKIIK